MRRFFFTASENSGPVVTLDKEQSHHLVKVLRMRTGEDIELFDGSGSLYHGRVERLGSQVLVRLLGQVNAGHEEKSSLWVCQGDLKGKKMDLIVQKCTELGVDRFLSFSSSRSQGRSDDGRRDRKYERWRKLVESACKQSRRLRLMHLEQEASFDGLMKFSWPSQPALKLMFWEEEPLQRLSELDLKINDGSVCLMLGPEGGFSEQEVAAARQCGWRTISLGNQILRAETATISAVSIVQHLRGVM